MTTVLIGFIIAFACGALATRGIIPVAKRFGIVDKPDHFRKVHARDMPLLGGVALFIAVLIPVAALCWFLPGKAIAVELLSNHQLKGLFFGSFIALSLGAVDDAVEMRARYKLLLQIAAVLTAYAFGFRIPGVTIPFIGTIWLGWFTLPVTMFWFLGCMNAINLMDGLDGLAAGISLFVILSLGLVCLVTGHIGNLFLLACIAGAVLAFLLYNFHPARIFLGDSGSMLLGFLIAALSLHSSRKTETAVALFIPMIALGLPIVDTSMAILRRWMRRLPVSAADRRHVHHLLLALGLSQRNVVLVIYGICILFGLGAVTVATGREEAIVVVLGAIAIIAFVCIRVLGNLRLTDLFRRLTQDLEQRRITNEAKISIEKAADRLHTAVSLNGAWDEACQAFEKLQLDHVNLHINGDTGHDLTLNWASQEQDDHEHDGIISETWTASLDLTVGRHHLGEIRVWRHLDHRLHLHELFELLIRLRGNLARAVNRILDANDDIQTMTTQTPTQQ